MRAAAIAMAVLAAAMASACSLVVDVGDLRDSGAEADDTDGISPDVDVPTDDSVEPDADSGGDADAADADGDADDDGSVDDAHPDTDGDVEPDADADDASDADVIDGADADADVADGADADGDADTADGADAPVDSDADGTTVGPPALIFGEMTSSGAPAASTGCVASGTGFCLRSDSLDPGAVELTGGAFRLRGIVVGGGRP
jgi:hypothetical protein